MTTQKILKAWMKRWGPLPPDMQERFLARQETVELQAFSRMTVLEAIGRHKKLSAILGEVRATSQW